MAATLHTKEKGEKKWLQRSPIFIDCNVGPCLQAKMNKTAK